MLRRSQSVVEYYPSHKGYKCGYCKNPGTNFSHGMWAHSLTVEDYQSLIDRGWRRSGCYCYKPMMDQTCCPQYTIKCEVLNFQISKSQKKILKRMTKFLRNELKNDHSKDISENQEDIDISNEEITRDIRHLAQKNVSEINVPFVNVEFNEKPRINLVKGKTQKESTSVSGSSEEQLPNSNNRNTMHTRNEITNVVPRKKAKLLRLQHKQNKLLAQGKSQSEIDSIMKKKKQQNVVKTFEELFEEVHTGPRKLEVKLVAVLSKEFRDTIDASTEIYKKYQMAIHGDSPEECERKSFYNFLIRNPLQSSASDSGPPQGYGAFHDQYWLDNELIAVGVIDILPSCISSVYFFYDPAYRHLSLGTFSSLREVYLTRQLNKVISDLKYYYMGFYIHTCPKMRYKAKMRPSKLLCPETYTWCDIDPCLEKLDKEKYSRLNNDIDAIDENGVVDFREVIVSFMDRVMPYRQYDSTWITKEDKDEVEEYASLVGMPCARRMILYR